ncbi:hypothetical protein [Kaarinaea lacus]
MAYNLKIIENPEYLHFIVTGKNSKKNVMQYLQEILHECQTRKCTKVLIEERLTGPRLKMFPVFEVAKSGSIEVLGHFEAIAYVDVNARGDLMQFAETVATNRGIPVTVFSTVAEAQSWLNETVLHVENP